MFSPSLISMIFHCLHPEARFSWANAQFNTDDDVAEALDRLE